MRMHKKFLDVIISSGNTYFIDMPIIIKICYSLDLDEVIHFKVFSYGNIIQTKISLNVDALIVSIFISYCLLLRIILV